ncbi:MAG: 6-phosphogluconolactonase [Pyrinomonadaceae bacterium]|nr:6-phosphogluconolactonase [Pyrinomonadaceae bacterium]
MKRLRIGKAHVEVWANAHQLINRAAELFAETARQVVAEHDSFAVALSGGTTPRALYEMLAGEVYAPQIPWEEMLVFWSDERCVPPEADESNYRMAYEAMLARVPVPVNQIHRMRGEDEPEQAARDYEKLLQEKLGNPPRFDLILLGMGEDGHTASLFPNSPALHDTEHLVAAPYVEKLKAHRLTMTLVTINAARNVTFLATGEAKAATLRAVLEGEKDARRYPSQLVEPTGGELIWLVDEAAASRLTI